MAKRERRRGTSYIYALVDPRTGIIRYVGKTTNPSFRLEGHLRDRRRCERVKWLRELKHANLEPVMVILEVVHAPVRWQDREVFWIAMGRELGWDLTNVADGGDAPAPPSRKGPPPQSRRMNSIRI